MLTAHDVKQGSLEWHELRSKHITASEAPIIMGASPYMRREKLAAIKRGEIAEEVFKKSEIMEAGHRAESDARQIAEELIGDMLLPLVVTRNLDGMPLLASMDGITEDFSIGWEHKLFNRKHAEHVMFHDEPPEMHYWQIEHQMLVTGAKEILYMLSSKERGEFPVTCWYKSKEDRRERLIKELAKFCEEVLWTQRL
jgi:putative phage-type endonuclease